MIPILDSKRQYAQIGAEVEKAVCEVLRSGSYILGPNCKALEVELATHFETLNQVRVINNYYQNEQKGIEQEAKKND